MVVIGGEQKELHGEASPANISNDYIYRYFYLIYKYMYYIKCVKCYANPI